MAEPWPNHGPGSVGLGLSPAEFFFHGEKRRRLGVSEVLLGLTLQESDGQKDLTFKKSDLTFKKSDGNNRNPVLVDH